MSIVIKNSKGNKRDYADILMNVGESFYDKEKFIDETKQLGASKRIAGYPQFVKLGKSRMFFCIGSGRAEDEEGNFNHGMIFGYVTISGIQIISEKIPDKYLGTDITAVQPMFVQYSEPPRGCGKRTIGAIYIVSNPNQWSNRGERENFKDDFTEIEGGITLLEPQIMSPYKHFRGLKYVDGDLLLNCDIDNDWELNINRVRLPDKATIIQNVINEIETKRNDDDKGKPINIEMVVERCSEIKDLKTGSRGWIRKMNILGILSDDNKFVIL